MLDSNNEKKEKKKISNSSEDLSTRMNLTIYNSYTAQACVLVILGLYQSLEYPVQLIIFWCWEWKRNHLAFKIHGSLFFFKLSDLWFIKNFHLICIFNFKLIFKIIFLQTD